MLPLLVAVLLAAVVLAQNPTTAPIGTTTYVTPTPAIQGEFYRPYFFHEHPNICGRVPELADYKGGAKVWDYYSTMNLTPNILYLAEAQCGTCQSNAGVAGQLAKRWEDFSNQARRAHLGVDIKVAAINRNHPKSKKKLKMMKKSMGKRWGVNKWVSVVQDTNENRIWDALGDYMIDNGGKYLNETTLFQSKKNDMYLVDQWGRIIRFLRDGILIRSRTNTGESSLHWRDIIHLTFLKTKERKSVCDELQYEYKLCRVSEEWSLNGISFSDLRVGTALTIIVFIRADLEEFTTNGVLSDLIDLSEQWSAPSYVVIVDSVPQSKTSFATANLYKQTRNAGIALLLDEDNRVASQYMAAPGDVMAADEFGRVIGFFNRVDFSDAALVDKLKDLHLNWNPLCDQFIEAEMRGTATFSTPSYSPTPSAPYFYSTSEGYFKKK